ncbi:hypothetical protein ACLB2K_016903 [Fragaria x ananassa]
MSDELAQDLSPLKVYKDGRVERLLGTARVPASIHPETGVQSKDVVISTSPPISARLYIPKSSASSESSQKLPVLVYFHGDGFCIESSFSPTYHNYLNSFVSEANVVAVSVDYRTHSAVTRYCPFWAHRPSRFCFRQLRSSFPVGHPSWDCSRIIMLNLGVPNPSEAAEPPKGLVLDWRWTCTYTIHNPSPFGRCGILQSTLLRSPTPSSAHSHHTTEWL